MTHLELSQSNVIQAVDIISYTIKKTIKINDDRFLNDREIFIVPTPKKKRENALFFCSFSIIQISSLQNLEYIL